MNLHDLGFSFGDLGTVGIRLSYHCCLFLALKD